MRNKFTGLAAFAVTGALLSNLWMTSGPPPRPVPPGGDVGIQQWLSSREASQIELNNTLVETRPLSAPSSQATTTCHKLARVAQQLLRSGPAPLPHLETAANAGIAQFTEAAQACLASDFALMRRHIDDGTTLRADAQPTLDQIMAGQHYGH